MKKISIRTIRITVAVIAVIAFPFIVSAQPTFSGGTGTASSPYQIASPADLATFALLVNAPLTNASFADKYYRLMSDIDLSTHDNWTPIGAGLIRADGRTDRLTFRGVFDGAGKKIVNLKIMSAVRVPESFQGQGFFGVVEGGVVKNLWLDDASVVVNAGTVGGIAGAVIAGGVIENCYVVGGISGVGSIGGVAGHIDDNSVVNNCYVIGDVIGADRVGGIAGHVYSSSIIGCYATGNVSDGGVAVSSTAGHVWNSVIAESEVFDPQTNVEKMLTVMPGELLSHVVAGVNNTLPIVAVVSESATDTVGGIMAGPNPADRRSGSVKFFRQGGRIQRGSLSISDPMGKFVKKISLIDGSADGGGLGWRQVGSWDLKDRRGRFVPEGSYVAKGTVVGADGKRERVSVLIGVR